MQTTFAMMNSSKSLSQIFLVESYRLVFDSLESKVFSERERRCQALQYLKGRWASRHTAARSSSPLRISGAGLFSRCLSRSGEYGSLRGKCRGCSVYSVQSLQFRQLGWILFFHKIIRHARRQQHLEVSGNRPCWAGWERAHWR